MRAFRWVPVIRYDVFDDGGRFRLSGVQGLCPSFAEILSQRKHTLRGDGDAKKRGCAGKGRHVMLQGCRLERLQGFNTLHAGRGR